MLQEEGLLWLLEGLLHLLVGLLCLLPDMQKSLLPLPSALRHLGALHLAGQLIGLHLAHPAARPRLPVSAA